jgi:hypothetical protein
MSSSPTYVNCIIDYSTSYTRGRVESQMNEPHDEEGGLDVIDDDDDSCRGLTRYT